MPDPHQPKNRDLAAKLLRAAEPLDLTQRAEQPAQVGPYRVLRTLGSGGMGVVYEATRPDAPERRVAIKVLTEGAEAQPQERQRFVREVRALAAIAHPNVARVRDVGEHEGALFVALDLLPGGSLKALYERAAPLPPERVAELGVQLAEGLAAAHAEGLLHRDVKPENVLLDASGRPVLCDFGLAKALLVNEESQALTQSWVVLGTPGYLAPEQASTGDVGPTADVYGLGATLYFLLCGRPPVVGDTPASVVAGAACQTPPPLRSFRDDVPPWLEGAILRCLERDPAARWQ
ncbi:MAG: serine/threonine protein kinase, partial [Planctomycetes bacterium]|nr:serine/threonine protein kinase [Planctomycetota bacterium]